MSEYQNSVDRMSQNMLAKLDANKHKGRWEDVNPLWAFKRIVDEASELMEAVLSGQSPEEVWKEAADVANFALIVAESYEKEKKQ